MINSIKKIKKIPQRWQRRGKPALPAYIKKRFSHTHKQNETKLLQEIAHLHERINEMKEELEELNNQFYFARNLNEIREQRQNEASFSYYA